MEAVGRVAANLPVGVQGVAGGGSLPASPVGDRRCCNVNGNGSRLSLHARCKAVQLKSGMRMMDDDFVCSIAQRSVGGSSSSSADVGRQDSPTSVSIVSPSVHDSFPRLEGGIKNIASLNFPCARGVSGRGSLFLTGAAAFMASLEVQGVMVMHAIGSESESGGNGDAASAAVAAVSRGPSWLAPTIIAFPLFSYFLFGVYRDKINPGAKVTDWLFILVAVGIVANIVMRATLGVRLY